jgi:monoamine oxidase
MSASGPTQTAILGLAKELGVETFKTYAKGKTVLAVGGGRLTAGLDDRGKSEDIQRVKEKLGTMAKEVPLAAPWTAKKARERSVFPPVKPPSSY